MSRYHGGVDIDRVYTIHEIIDMHDRGLLKGPALDGYVVRASGDKTIRFVHWTEPTVNRQTPGSQDPDGRTREGLRTYVQTKGDWIEEGMAALEEAHPMVRRTPQQRMESMTARLMSEVAKTGSVTGLSEDLVRSIAGESWKKGEPITAEAVRRVAAHFLGNAQVDNREADSHRTTRAHQFA